MDIDITSDSERIRPMKSEVMSLIGDSTYLRNSTAWKSEVSLYDGINKTIDSIKLNLNKYKTEGYTI